VILTYLERLVNPEASCSQLELQEVVFRLNRNNSTFESVRAIPGVDFTQLSLATFLFGNTLYNGLQVATL